MADAAVGPVDLGFVSKNKTQGSNTNPLNTPANYNSIATLRARLTALSSTSYSAARLNSMTVNDMVYAVRLNDDIGTLTTDDLYF